MDLDTLCGLQIFSGMEKGDVKTVTNYMEQHSYRKNEDIFQKDDQGGTMYIVIEGEVQINAPIAHDIKKSLLCVPAGAVFGELSLFTHETRSADAVALENTRLLSLNTDTFKQMLTETPVGGGKLLVFLTTVISDRLRDMTEMYCQALEWSLSVSGAIELHMEQLISNSVNLTVKLSNGDAIRGRLLKIDEHAAGHVIFMQSKTGELQIIPYHAVISMSFDEDAFKLKPRQDLL